MKHLRNKILLLLMLLVSATTLFARPHLNDLNIRVVLMKNGDARITETRRMEIDSEGGARLPTQAVGTSIVAGTGKKANAVL